MATGRIGVTPVLRTRWSKLPTTGTTVLSGLDDNSVALVYDAGYEAVYRNGVLLSRGNDYTATDGTTVTLIDATLATDIIEIFANDLVPLTDAISKGQYNAKGALLSATAASTPAVLAVGSNDQVLTADSTTSTGLKWAAAGGWSPNLTLLNTGGTALTGAGTITVNVSSYDSYFVYMENASSTIASPYMRLRINGDSGANYSWVNVGLQGTSAYAASSSGVASFYTLGRNGNDATNSMYAMITILGGKTTGLKPINAVAIGDGTATNISVSTNGYYYGSSAITSISLLASTGNFDAGTVYVYGG